MNTDDFRYMWRGKHLQTLPLPEARLLSPIDIRGTSKNHALLLLHGFSSSPAVYRELIPSLTMYDAIVCPVLPGHADNLASFSSVKAREWLTAAEASCAHLLRDYKTVDVMGLSLGGLLACHLSNRFALNHLYLLAPSLSLHLKTTPALKLARFLYKLGFRTIRNRAGNLHTSSFSELAYRKLPIAAIIEILDLVNTFEFLPPTCPVDLFLGTFDEVVNSQEVVKLFTGLPNAKVHWLTNSAHVLALDGDIAAIISCIKNNWQDEGLNAMS